MKTFRIEGGHLTMPRWGRGLRRGKVYGHVVNTYTPEQLKKMTVEEINEAINRDIYEDAWQRQKENPVRYRSCKRAEGIETLLFMCPKCKRLGTVQSKKHSVFCDCGFSTEMTEYGTFEPAQPFENVAQWDAWQLECFEKGEYAPESKVQEENIKLFRLDEKKKTQLAHGTLKLEEDMLKVEDQAFELKQITNLALIQKKLIVFTYQDTYYELRADKPKCLRKYLIVWKKKNDAVQKGA